MALPCWNRYSSTRWINEIPVIAISAEQTDSFMERAYDLGATDYPGRSFHALVVRLVDPKNMTACRLDDVGP